MVSELRLRSKRSHSLHSATLKITSRSLTDQSTLPAVQKSASWVDLFILPLVVHARLKLLTSNLVMLTKCVPMSAARGINISANDAGKSLARIADIVLPDKGKRVP
jgi:hypothetical protein